MKINIYFDGACHNQRNTSSPMGMGVAVEIDGVYEPDISLAIYNDGSEVRGTNNIAEWIGCVEAMRTAKDLRKSYPKAEINVYSDSQIIACQFNGTYTINNDAFRPYHRQAHEHAGPALVKFVQWIPREKNKQADILSKMGLHGNNPESKHYAKYRTDN